MGVAEQHGPEAVDGQGDGVGQVVEQCHVTFGESGCGPWRDRVGDRRGVAAGQVDQFAVRVAAHPHDAVAEVDQAVEHLDGLRAGRDVAGEDQAVGGCDVGLGEHGIERREHAMDVGEHRDGLRRGVTVLHRLRVYHS